MALGDKPCQTLLNPAGVVGKTFTPAFSSVLLPDVSNCSRGCRLDSCICTKEGKFELRTQMADKNLGRLKDGNLPQRNTAAGRRLFLQTPYSPPPWSYGLEIQKYDRRSNFDEKPLWMVLSWLAQVREQNQVLQNFSSESKFPMYAAKFLHLKFIKTNVKDCQLAVLSLQFMEGNHDTSFLYAESSK